MDHSREEDCGFQRIGFNSHGESSYVEVDSDSSPNQEMRPIDMLQKGYIRDFKYMMIWKPEWNSSKDLLRRLGWTMVDAAIMNPNLMEVPLGQFIVMNILMWNCRGALNPDFKR